jgi:hypothetical protein
MCFHWTACDMKQEYWWSDRQRWTKFSTSWFLYLCPVAVRASSPEFLITEALQTAAEPNCYLISLTFLVAYHQQWCICPQMSPGRQCRLSDLPHSLVSKWREKQITEDSFDKDPWLSALNYLTQECLTAYSATHKRQGVTEACTN